MVEKDIPMLNDTSDGKTFLEARIIELETENEQLREQIAKITDPVYLEEKLRQIGINDIMAAEALSRTGAVKVPATSEGQQEPVAYDAGVIAALLDASMKQDEIAVGSVKRAARVRELVHWFARLAQDEANPKWTRPHASELAYYIATTSTRPSEQAVTKAMVEAAIAAMFHGHGWFPPPYAMRTALKAAMETYMTDAQTEARAITNPAADVADVAIRAYLSRRLNALKEHLKNQPLTHADCVDIATIGEAATALEAQAARIAELVAVVADLATDLNGERKG